MRKYNRLTIIEGTIEKGNHNVYCQAICDCGNTIRAPYYHIIIGHKKSCGCLLREYRKTLVGANKKLQAAKSRVANIINRKQPNAGNKLNQRNIIWLESKGAYRVHMTRNGIRRQTDRKNLQEAIEVRERWILDYKNGQWGPLI